MGARIGSETEWKAVDVDRLLVGGGVDVAVGREAEVDVEAPRAARPQGLAEADDILRNHRLRMRCSREAELIVRLLVLLFHKQSARELQPDPQQARIAIENAAK